MTRSYFNAEQSNFPSYTMDVKKHRDISTGGNYIELVFNKIRNAPGEPDMLQTTDFYFVTEEVKALRDHLTDILQWAELDNLSPLPSSWQDFIDKQEFSYLLSKYGELIKLGTTNKRVLMSLFYEMYKIGIFTNSVDGPSDSEPDSEPESESWADLITRGEFTDIRDKLGNLRHKIGTSSDFILKELLTLLFQGGHLR